MGASGRSRCRLGTQKRGSQNCGVEWINRKLCSPEPFDSGSSRFIPKDASLRQFIYQFAWRKAADVSNWGNHFWIKYHK